MKKLILSFLFALSLLFVVTSCETTPDCEKNSYGDVIVKNSTSYQIKVDVTTGNSEYNSERWLSAGNSTTYSRIPAGSIKAWASFNGSTWTYKSHYLSSCDELQVTWYLSAKSSDVLFISINGGELLETTKGVK